jgi:hypothetical protein
MEDPEPVLQQPVRVFIGEGTFCPGFQFIPGNQLHPTVLELFQRARAYGAGLPWDDLWWRALVLPLLLTAGSRSTSALAASRSAVSVASLVRMSATASRAASRSAQTPAS